MARETLKVLWIRGRRRAEVGFGGKNRELPLSGIVLGSYLPTAGSNNSSPEHIRNRETKDWERGRVW